MDKFDQLDKHLERWSVPSEVDAIVRSAMAVATDEGLKLSDGCTEQYASIAARGKPIAVFVGRTRLSMALDPVSAERAHGADGTLGLEKDSGVTWFIHCSFDALGVPEKARSVRALMIEAFRRSARNDRQAGSANREERRQAAAEANVAKCPVPGCNLPMVGGSCGFHD